jgi:alpha-N-arabinofuranosidase
MNFLFLRNPKEENYSLTAHPGFLEISLDPDTLSSKGSPSYVCRRQQAFNFTAKTHMSFLPKTENEQAGLAIYQSQSYNYQFLVGRQGEKTTLSLVRTYQDKLETIASSLLDKLYPELHLRIIEQEQDLSFSYSTDGEVYRTLTDHVDARILSTDVAGGFVGNTIGLYATSNGKPSTTKAGFDYFSYK